MSKKPTVETESGEIAQKQKPRDFSGGLAPLARRLGGDIRQYDSTTPANASQIASHSATTARDEQVQKTRQPLRDRPGAESVVFLNDELRVDHWNQRRGRYWVTNYKIPKNVRCILRKAGQTGSSTFPVAKSHQWQIYRYGRWNSATFLDVENAIRDASLILDS